jgi:hypothetical protein
VTLDALTGAAGLATFFLAVAVVVAPHEPDAGLKRRP